MAAATMSMKMKKREQEIELVDLSTGEQHVIHQERRRRRRRRHKRITAAFIEEAVHEMEKAHDLFYDQPYYHMPERQAMVEPGQKLEHGKGQ